MNDTPEQLREQIAQLQRQLIAANEKLQAACLKGMDAHVIIDAWKLSHEELTKERDEAKAMLDRMTALRDEQVANVQKQWQATQLVGEQLKTLRTSLAPIREAVCHALCTCMTIRPQLCGRCSALTLLDKLTGGKA